MTLARATTRSPARRARRRRPPAMRVCPLRQRLRTPALRYGAPLTHPSHRRGAPGVRCDRHDERRVSICCYLRPGAGCFHCHVLLARGDTLFRSRALLSAGCATVEPSAAGDSEAPQSLLPSQSAPSTCTRAHLGSLSKQNALLPSLSPLGRTIERRCAPRRARVSRGTNGRFLRGLCVQQCPCCGTRLDLATRRRWRFSTCASPFCCSSTRSPS